MPAGSIVVFTSCVMCRGVSAEQASRLSVPRCNGLRADGGQNANIIWREVAGQLEKSLPAAPNMMDAAEADVLACFGFPKVHRVKIHSTNTLERLNKEVKRRADVVGIFLNKESITRLQGAVLTEQNEK